MDLLKIPNLSKELSSGENSILRFGVCAMQGWRKRMEDTHITDISKGENGRFNIFGVLDIHNKNAQSQNKLTKGFIIDQIKNHPLIKKF